MYRQFLMMTFFCLMSPPLFAQTLPQCYEWALKQSETVSIQEENIRAVEAKYLQAVGSVLPKIAFKGSEFLQDDSAAAGGSDVSNTFTRFSRPEFKFNAKQPIFSGFREFHILAANRSEKEAHTAAWEGAKRNLFVDVAQAFYTVLQ